MDEIDTIKALYDGNHLEPEDLLKAQKTLHKLIMLLRSRL